MKLLLDKDATKEGILGGLDWLKGKMTADDTAVVFYAGHGHRDRKTGQFYMLPVDVDPADLEKTGVTGTAIKDKLKAVPGRVLVLLDACHSGSIGQSPADPGSLTDDVQRQLAAPDCGVVVMCAAMAQEEAGEAAAVKHGFFTAALLSGLGGGAAQSGRPDPPVGAELLRRGGGVRAEQGRAARRRGPALHRDVVPPGQAAGQGGREVIRFGLPRPLGIHPENVHNATLLLRNGVDSVRRDRSRRGPGRP